MNDTVPPDSKQINESPPPPPFPQSVNDKEQPIVTFVRFVISHFWWIVGAAAAVKLISYFISPARNATAGYHYAKLLIGFVSYGGILALVAFIISKCVKSKRNVFRIAFAILFALACLLDVPVAIMRSKANTAVDDLVKSYAAFEALMKYEDDPVWVIQPSQYSAGMRKTPYGDGDKYFMLSYCYANAYDGYPKDVGKAVQLCQMAATHGNYKAQSLLRKAGFLWQRKKSRW